MTRALAAAALLALAWPAAARAADLGGGSPARGLGGYRGQLTLVSLRTAPGRAVVRALVAARCGVGAIKARATVAPDGRFAVSAVKRDRDPDEAGVRRVARVFVTGRVTGVTATGTARTKIKLTRSGHVVERCRTGARSWQARTPVAETVSGPPRASRGYFGLTRQTTHPRAIVLRVEAGAGHVQPVAFDYALDCGKRTREGHNITPGGAIAADGSFHLAERFMLRFSDAEERYRVKVSGRFTLRGVRGTLSVTSVARSLAGAVIERCHTGSVPFAGAL